MHAHLVFTFSWFFSHEIARLNVLWLFYHLLVVFSHASFLPHHHHSLLLVHTADRVLRLYDPVTLALTQRFQDHVERVQWHRPVFCGTGAFVAVGMLWRWLV